MWPPPSAAGAGHESGRRHEPPPPLGPRLRAIRDDAQPTGRAATRPLTSLVARLPPLVLEILEDGSAALALLAAIVSVLGGSAVFLLLGAHEPVRSVWDLRDERHGTAGAA
jgi:hypothetical protein